MKTWSFNVRCLLRDANDLDRLFRVLLGSTFRVICMCVNVSTNNLTNHAGYSLHFHRPASKYPKRKMLKKILIKVLIALIFLPYILFPLCCQHIDINPCHGHLFMREREKERERVYQNALRAFWSPVNSSLSLSCCVIDLFLKSHQ